MRRWIGWAVGVIVLVGAAQAQPASSFATEQDWIVADITGAIAQMAMYAKTQLPLPAQTPAPVEIKDHIWSPEDYTAFARSLLGDAAAASGAAADDASTLSALTDLRTSVLIAENTRVSALLARDMLSPHAHEAAALLIGALVLREAAGTFDDVRPALSRMTAHLAFARALRRTQPPAAAHSATSRAASAAAAAASGSPADSLDEALANVIILTSAGRQRDAIAHLDALAGRTSAAPVRAWINALRLRTTGDWRILPQPSTATLLERFEHARALSKRSSSSRMLDFLDTFDTAHVPDWPRIGLSGAFSVEAGNRLTVRALVDEHDEINAVWKAFRSW